MEALILSDQSNLLDVMAQAQAARQYALESTQWLSAEDIVAQSAPPAALRPSPIVWKAERRLFSIQIAGAARFPEYGLQFSTNQIGPKGLEPKPVMADIIAALTPELDNWQMAQWFASHNGSLEGRRPIDVLDEAPQLVVAAAQFEAKGIQHG